VYCAEALHVTQGVLSADMNRQVQACTDFYDYANGAWRAQNPVPPGLTRWSRRIAARNDNWLRQQSVIEEAMHRKDRHAGSPEQIAGDHYAACMDESQVDAAGMAPLTPLISEIRAATSRADVESAMRHLHDIAIPVGFTLSSNPGYHEPGRFITTIAAGALGLPDRDYYLKSEAHFSEARKKYRQHVATLLAWAGHAEADAQAAASSIFALEKRMAESSLDAEAAADPAATDHVTSFEQLKGLTPHFDWEAYFDQAAIPKLSVNVADPKGLQALDRALAEVSVDTWKSYLLFQLLDSASPSLSKQFSQEAYSFHDRDLANVSEVPSRARSCVQSTETLFGEPLARLYVAKYFPPSSKARVQDIVANLRAALRDRVVAAQWLSPPTREIALRKVDTTDVQIGYPDHWQDYSGVRVRRDDFWENIAAGRRFNVNQDRRLAGRPVTRDFWLPTPSASSGDGYIIVELNKMVLPAGMMQPPFFNADANDAVNYGALGIAVAHDLTHFIDTLGEANDVEGRPTHWWTDPDRKAFESRSQCVEHQFDGYFIEPGTHHDGKRVSSESVADLAGVGIGFRALQISLQKHPIAVAAGLTPEQQFFVSWGQTSGAAMTLEAQRKLVSSDPHPVPKFRVIGPLSNSPAFQRAFACPVSAAMVRPPETRCEVW
jgi:endothelin-converting enzyme/putative endopeptidase